MPSVVNLALHYRYAYQGTVSNRQAMEIQLWYRRGADFHAECFMWCTAEGSLPETPEQQIDIDTGESLAYIWPG